MNSHHIRLIDNTYTAEEAREVLLELIQSKINFLNKTIFSLDVRYGADTTHLSKRVRELKQEITDLKRFMHAYDGEDIAIEIGCTVAVQIKANANHAIS